MSLVSNQNKTPTLNVMPTQWSVLKDIDDIEPLNDSDLPCLLEVRDVLKKHNRLSRLGVCLLHSHFDLNSDEIMLEYTDAEQRVLTTKAVRNDHNTDNKVATMWMLRDLDRQTISYCAKTTSGWHKVFKKTTNVTLNTMAWCKSYCYKYAFGHTEHHRRVKE